MTSPADGVERAIELAQKAERTADEVAFLERFFADHLRPRPGEDPAAHAARLGTPEMFRLYRQLRTAVVFDPPEPRPPAPLAARPEHDEAVAARVLSERVPPASCHADFVDVEEDYTPAGPTEIARSNDPPPEPPTPARAPRRTGTAAGPPGWPARLRRQVSDFLHRRRLAARLTLGALAIVGLSYGMMYLINRQAHRSAEPIRQIQQQTGAAAEGISADPSRAPIDNKVRSASPAPKTTSR